MPLLHPALQSGELLALFGHFLVLSLLAVGGAITTAPDMHRFVVDEHHWLGNAEFSASVAIALDEAVRSGRVLSGDLLLLVVFGAGLTWGSAVIEW